MHGTRHGKVWHFANLCDGGSGPLCKDGLDAGREYYRWQGDDDTLSPEGRVRVLERCKTYCINSGALKKE